MQKDEYHRHHTTPDTGKHAPHPTYSTTRHLIDTSHTTSTLAATINTPHCTDSIHTIYDCWTTTLPPTPIFTKSDLPTDTCRKCTLLQKLNTSTTCMLRQITQRPLRTIIRYRTETINHDININRLRNACRAARPLRIPAQQLRILSTTPQILGENLLTTRSMTISQQIQATQDTYGHQMVPPPNTSLFYGTLVHDIARPAGVTMYLHRPQTKGHRCLPTYQTSVSASPYMTQSHNFYLNPVAVLDPQDTTGPPSTCLHDSRPLDTYSNTYFRTLPHLSYPTSGDERSHESTHTET